MDFMQLLVITLTKQKPDYQFCAVSLRLTLIALLFTRKKGGEWKENDEEIGSLLAQGVES